MKRAKHRSKGKGLHPGPFFCFIDHDMDKIFWFVTLCIVLRVMGMIFHFSAADSTTSSHSSQGISRIILRKVQEIVPFLFGKLSMDEMVNLIETPVRKLAHFSEYALYSFCMQIHLFFGWNIYRKHSFRKSISETPKIIARKVFILLGGIFCVLYAVSDEIHQAFVPGRACRFFDVCVDSIGVLTGILLFFILFFPFLDGRCRKGYNEEKSGFLGNIIK